MGFALGAKVSLHETQKKNLGGSPRLREHSAHTAGLHWLHPKVKPAVLLQLIRLITRLYLFRLRANPLETLGNPPVYTNISLADRGPYYLTQRESAGTRSGGHGGNLRIYVIYTYSDFFPKMIRRGLDVNPMRVDMSHPKDQSECQNDKR